MINTYREIDNLQLKLEKYLQLDNNQIKKYIKFKFKNNITQLQEILKDLKNYLNSQK